MIRIVVTAMGLVASALLVGGLVAVGAMSASEHAAVRSFSSEWVAPQEEIKVTITIPDNGPFEQVQETLPEGFTFIGTTLSDAAVGSTVGTLKFTLLGDEEFIYTVRAPEEEGEYSFNGVLLDSFRNQEAIGGATILRVGSPPTPTPPPTAIPTATPLPTPIPEPTPEPAPIVEPTATPEPTVKPVADPSITPAPTATLAPTVTPLPRATETATPEPSPTTTPTRTPVPTTTPIPVPTATQAPTDSPTALPPPEPGSTETPAVEDDGGIPEPFLIVILIVIGGWVFAGVVVLFILVRRRWPWSIFPTRRRAPTPLLDEEEEP